MNLIKWFKELLIGKDIITKLPNGGELHERNYAGKWYFLNNNIHREDGPAVEYPDGHKQWWINGKRHREDGPAIEWGNGDKSWCLNHKIMSQEEFERLMRLKAFW
jgi:hypothetical protein